MTGFLNVYKPSGLSSAAAVAQVKRLVRTPCGHMGTLDPLAEGVLPVGVGNASRLFDYFLSKKKTYTARFRFGATTATLDGEGEVVRGGRVPAEAEIAAALPALTGTIEQIPPAYSAVSVRGRRGYALARAGEEVSLPPRAVTVDHFRLCGQTAPDEFEFCIVCGAGTYIRALARDLAEALDSGRIAAFCADVLSTEPPSPENPLLKARNCYLTPHIAWATLEARKRLMKIAADNIKEFIEGKPLTNKIV